MIYIHRIDLLVAVLSQKICRRIQNQLKDSDVFTNRINMIAIDFTSDNFLTGDKNLSLAYMRVIILIVLKYDSIHPCICCLLLVR